MFISHLIAPFKSAGHCVFCPFLKICSFLLLLCVDSLFYTLIFYQLYMLQASSFFFSFVVFFGKQKLLILMQFLINAIPYAYSVLRKPCLDG